jgi:hypothetical protein
MIQNNLLVLIFITKCLLKRFQTKDNTNSLKKSVMFLVIEFFCEVPNYSFELNVRLSVRPSDSDGRTIRIGRSDEKHFFFFLHKLTLTTQPHQKIRFLEIFFRILNMSAIVSNLHKKKINFFRNPQK